MYKCVFAMSGSIVCVKKHQCGHGAGNFIHVALAGKHVLLALAFRMPWNCINFLPSQNSILSGKW